MRIALLHDRFSGPEIFRGFLAGASVGPASISSHSPDLGRAVGFDFAAWTRNAMQTLESDPVPDCIVAAGGAVVPAVLFARSNPVPILAIEPETQRAIPAAVLNAPLSDERTTTTENVDTASDLVAAVFSRAASGEAAPKGTDRAAAIAAMVEAFTCGLSASSREVVRTSLDSRFDELYELAARTDWTRMPTEAAPWEDQIAALKRDFISFRRPSDNREFDRWRDEPIAQAARGIVVESQCRSEFPWLEDPTAVRNLIDRIAAPI